jgi:hypothetical protein
MKQIVKDIRSRRDEVKKLKYKGNGTEWEDFVEGKEDIITKTVVLKSRKSSVLNIAIRKEENLRHVVLEMDRVVKKCMCE